MSRVALIRAARPCAFAAAVLTSWVILWHFHDHFWYPSDEGIFANQAERIASGEILNVEVQDLHSGYGTFVNAAALRVFGPSLLSLRYPLIAAALLQACLAFMLLARRSLMVAATGAVATVSLGVIQFLNPTPNWYCLTLAFGLAYWLHAAPREGALRLVGAGVLTGVIGLFRQLSGVWVALAVVAVALLDRPEAPSRGGALAKAVLVLLVMSLVGFLAASRQLEPGSLVLFSAWPIAILVVAFRRVQITDRQTVRALLQLAAGMAIGAAPLLAYSLIHGSSAAWFEDAVTSALHVGDIAGDMQGEPWFAALTGAAAEQTVHSFEFVKIANGVYWTLLPMLAAINGLLTIRALRRSEDPSELTLPLVAAFYSLVAIYMQNAIYLYFTAGLTLIAVLWLIGRSGFAVRCLGAGLTVLLTFVALIYHAGQPYSRTPRQALEGRRTTTTVDECALPRCGLRLDPADVEPYRRLVALIQQEVPPDAPIAALPSDAELYFLSNRPNPFRFYNSAMGIRTDAGLENALKIIEREMPRIITFRPADKYTTEPARAIMRRVRSRYDRIDTIGGVEVYRLRAQ